MNQGQNLAKIFSEVVSIDAWHSHFDENDDTATVHVDLTFLEGQLGSEADSQIRFNLALKRAELVFIIPKTEPLQVLQSSVDREPPIEGVARWIREHESEIQGAARSAVSASRQPKFDVSAEASASGKSKVSTASEITVPISNFKMSQSMDSEGNYRWEITSEAGNKLNGKVWNPVVKPRLKIKQTTKSNISPTCRVMVRCRREDFEITNIQPKSGAKIGSKFLFNKKAAAAAFIRNKLSELGLNNDNFDEEYMQICIAEVAVSQEVK
jgi:hypothetical protein